MWNVTDIYCFNVLSGLQNKACELKIPLDTASTAAAIKADSKEQDVKREKTPAASDKRVEVQEKKPIVVADKKIEIERKPPVFIAEQKPPIIIAEKKKSEPEKRVEVEKKPVAMAMEKKQEPEKRPSAGLVEKKLEPKNERHFYEIPKVDKKVEEKNAAALPPRKIVDQVFRYEKKDAGKLQREIKRPDEKNIGAQNHYGGGTPQGVYNKNYVPPASNSH